MGRFTNKHGVSIPVMWVIIYSEAGVSSGVLGDAFVYDTEQAAQDEADKSNAELREDESDIKYSIRRLTIWR